MHSSRLIFLSLSLLLALSSFVAASYPILMASNANLEDLSSVAFTDHNQLINATFGKLPERVPQKTLLYVVSTPYDSLETVSFVSQNRNKYPNQMDLLKNKKLNMLNKDNNINKQL